MSIFVFIVVTILIGLLVGGLARLALPGKDPMSLPATWGIGIVGSFAGGLVYAAIFGRNGGSIALSVLFATVIVYFVRRSRGGSLTRPGTPGGRRNRHQT